jgi:Calcineurin-like phosphoesterase
MRILVLGDCHGRLGHVARACENAARTHGIEAAIQVGDFGFYPRVIDGYLRTDGLRFSVPLYAIDGNHEDHQWLKAAHLSGVSRSWESHNLFYQGRGTVARLGGLSIGFIGGALHVDRPQEWAGRRDANSAREAIPQDPEWSNWITTADRNRALMEFRATVPDVVVTHSCPAGIGIGMTGLPELSEDVKRYVLNAGFFSGPDEDCGDGALAEVWDGLFVRPKAWIYGHFHCVHEKTLGDTRFTCVGSSDDSDGTRLIRAFVIDTEDPRARVNLLPGDLFPRHF